MAGKVEVDVREKHVLNEFGMMTDRFVEYRVSVDGVVTEDWHSTGISVVVVQEPAPRLD